MKEVWKDIKDYEGLYQVSNMGRVKRVARYIHSKPSRLHFNGEKRWFKEKILKKYLGVMGYYRIALCKCNTQKSIRIHRIVAQTFIPNPNNKPHINHKDGNKLNNYVDNLEWVTPLENVKHAIKTGLMDSKMLAKYSKKNLIKKVDMLTLDGEYIRTFDSMHNVYKYFGKNYQGGISECCNGKRNKTLGYKWRFNEKK